MKLVAIQLPLDFKDYIKKIKEKPRFKEIRYIGHKFTKKTLAKLKIGGDGFLYEHEKKMLWETILKYSKGFVSSLHKIGCANSKIIALIAIYIVSHVTLEFKANFCAKSLDT